MRRILSTLLFLPIAHAVAGTPPIPETVWIPLAGNAPGAELVQLEATLYSPQGVTRAPVVMFHHGSSGGPIPAGYTEKVTNFATFLTERGIAVLVPMRSGRGRSGGANNEEPSACTVAAALEGLNNATAAVDASLAYLRAQPWADMSRLAMAGHSRGGLLAPFYAAAHPGIVRATLNFSGGWKDDRCASPDINLALFDAAGRKATAPSMFVYGSGDGFYTDNSIKQYAQVYAAAGGKVEFKLYPPAEVNGHVLFRRSQRVWQEDVARFLRDAGMLPDPPA